VDAIRDAQVFAGICSFLTPLATVDMNGRFATVSGLAASGDCFETLGVGAALGRLPGRADDEDGAARVAAISYGTWVEEFGARPDVLGRSISIDGSAFTIVGVVTRSFSGPLVGFPARIYIPIHQMAAPAGFSYATLPQTLFARLPAGETAGQAAARLDALWPTWMAATVPPALDPGDRAEYFARRPAVTSAEYGVDYSLRDRFRRPLILLVALGSLVLLVASVNVGNLLFARAADRRRETAVRLALGATRWQIARQGLLESGIILVVAAAAGLVVASWCESLLLALFQASSPTFTLDVTPDGRVLAFAFGSAAIVFAAFAATPALKAADVDISTVQGMSRRTTGANTRVQRTAVIAQAALTIVLAATANVLVGALHSLRTSPVGVDVQHVLQLQLAPVPGGSARQGAPPAYYSALLDRVTATPGIAAAGLAADAAFNPARRPIDVSAPSGRSVPAAQQIVSGGFLGAMNIPLLEGSDFERTDTGDGGRTVMLSESLARRLFGTSGAVGRVIHVGKGSSGHTARVVGVAQNAVLTQPQKRTTDVVYENLWDGRILFPNLVVRTAGSDPTAVAKPIHDLVQGEGREFVSRTRTLQGSLDAALTQEFLMASLSGAFGILGLLLAAIGLYGLLAFTVTQRRNEIGVRLALGASPGRVLRSVVGDALQIVCAGMAVGVPLAWIAARTASQVVSSAGPGSALPVAIGGALLLIAAAAATLPPALRASWVDPVQSLRRE
jgi:predicted permease